MRSNGMGFFQGALAAQYGTRLDLPFEFALRPPRSDRGNQVEFPRLERLRLAEDDEVLSPRQLCHQR